MSGFDRVPPAYREAIEIARAWLPPAVKELPVRYLCGANPNFVGLHDHEGIAYQGRTLYYREVPHVDLSPVDGGAAVIVIPTRAVARPEWIVHEHGHVFGRAHPEHEPPITTEYSQWRQDDETNERASEALELLFSIDRWQWGDWEEMLAAEIFRPFREAVGA